MCLRMGVVPGCSENMRFSLGYSSEDLSRITLVLRYKRGVKTGNLFRKVDLGSGVVC